MLVNRHHVFEGQRLKVETVASVVVGRDSLWIAVDHDGLEAVITQCKRRMAAAIVKLDALTDAVRPAAEDHNFFAIGRRGLVFFFVGRVQVWREAFELAGAGVNALVYRGHAVLLAQLMNLFGRGAAFLDLHGHCQARVGEAHPLQAAQLGLLK